MFLNRIHYRLIVYFSGLMIVLMVITGLTLQWNIRRSLEHALGAKLETAAAAISVQFDTDRFTYLQNAGSRTRGNYLSQLRRIQNRSGLLRIYLFDDQLKSLLDTDTTIRAGSEYYQLQFYPQEMEQLRQARTAHSVLFEGIDGHPMMTGFAPVIWNGERIGGIAVDGSATSLNAVDRFNRRLMLIGFVGIIATVLLACMLARTITRPVDRLVKASRRISEGDYAKPIPKVDATEIGDLSHTMEEMRKNVVEREQNLKAMVAGIAHEIRNPLGGMELFLGLLRDELENNAQAQIHLTKITCEVRALNDIVQHFLEYAHPRKPHPEPCDLDVLMNELRMLTAGETEQNHVDWRIRLTGDTVVSADQHQLKRMLLNLIQNSIHAMPEGGTLTIQSDYGRKADILPAKRKSASPSNSADIGYRLTISDTGTGILFENQQLIFTPFFTTREKGTGLGLSIVKNLIEANGGSIRLVKSDQGGTVFELMFRRP